MPYQISYGWVLRKRHRKVFRTKDEARKSPQYKEMQWEQLKPRVVKTRKKKRKKK